MPKDRLGALRAVSCQLFQCFFFVCHKNLGLSDKKRIETLREGFNEKKTFFFRHCPNRGGGWGGQPMPEFFGPLFRGAFLVNKKSLFLQKCQCIELLTVF